jgi:UDP-2,3-diacylglucosamine pyrophosphatase LpxH
MERIHYRTVVISDTHLGARDAQSQFLLDFLKRIDCDYLYLAGDIFDLWKVKSGWYWPQINTNIVQLVMDKAANGTEVVYVPGNHDEMFRDYVGSEFNGVRILPETVHEAADGRRYLIIHGDEFDAVVMNNRWLAHLGGAAYDSLLWLNRHFNRVRRRLGFPYWSLSAFLKYKVKNAVSYISSFEEALAGEAERRGVDGIICGHIHHANVHTLTGGATYANSGDWVESCTALVENAEGGLEVLHWLDGAGEVVSLTEWRDRCA